MDTTNTEAPPAWVLSAPTERPIHRALRVARRVGVTRQVAVGRSVCVELAAVPSESQVLRAERRLSEQLEVRLNCDVARFPLGRGWLVVEVGAPADGLPNALDALGLTAWEVLASSDPALPVVVCLPRAAVVGPETLANGPVSAGLVVGALYETGGCRR